MGVEEPGSLGAAESGSQEVENLGTNKHQNDIQLLASSNSS
ncbi:MAG: hypothetical protein O4806_15770 [Trichodesmium sp. St5_bin8]|nr:hypothetical protein [Trichodesmium sp. St4_bin8_1]MDE5073229.1 hypothetical protein [Trichodesmium sp. St5_bin8]